MRIGLIPLDERPVNVRYPQMIAAIAGVELVVPPAPLLSAYRQPAPQGDLAAWIQERAPHLDALIVSCEMLGYGGLIASRITHDPARLVIERIELLRAVKRQHPQLTIYGFNLITRISNANDAIEEPDYWASYGTRFYQLSQLLDQREQGLPTGEGVEQLRGELPPEHYGDFIRRRARNHTVNLQALQLLADGVFDLLVLSSDDTSPYGLGSREKRWLAEWAARLELGDDRLLMYPGADEVGCVLLARCINQRHGHTPQFAVSYAPPGGEGIVAPYEDGPVRLTVERQVRALGGAIASGRGDLLMAVNTPVPRRSEWDSAYAAAERTERLPHLQQLVGELRELMARGQQVIVADVAYPNGADPVLIDLLREGIDLSMLAAYGAWNTAGNTIGTALAQGCAAQYTTTETGREVQQRFLLHRLLEDWGYQHLVRAQVRQWLAATTGRADTDATTLEETRVRIEGQLNSLIDDLPSFAGRYRIVPGSVRLPWKRTFEVDFELEGIGDRG